VIPRPVAAGRRLSAAARGWLRAHDPDLAATRRAGRTALVMPALFALCTEVLHAPTIASFAAFGSFSMLLLVEYGGPMVQRLRAQAGLAVAWLALICLGTLAAQVSWVAVLVTIPVVFLVLFSGVVSSVLAGSATALLLAFVLPVATPAPLAQLPDRLAGAGLAAGVSMFAICLLWPRSATDPLSAPAALVCRTAARQVRTDTSRLSREHGAPGREGCRALADESAAAAIALRRAFDATPYRPTGLSASSRALVRLVDELTWLSAIVAESSAAAASEDVPGCDPQACAVRGAVAAVLDQAADLLDDPHGELESLRVAVGMLVRAMQDMVQHSTAHLPAGCPADGDYDHVRRFLEVFQVSFRAQELGFAAVQVAGNVELAARAEQRGWFDRLLGREPSLGGAEGAGQGTGAWAAARERAAAHLRAPSVWLHNSLRGAVGLGVAVALARVTSAQHAFWVLLGTFSVLRSNALNTGQNALRAVAGTVAGSIAGAGLLALIGHHGTVLWFLLPAAILLAGIAPAAISFAAGQAAFTVTLVVLFNIGQNPDWRIVLLRIQDIGLGCAVSVLVALFFWPRGAAAAVDRALAEAYADAAAYLSDAVSYGLGFCADGRAVPADPPERSGYEAAASARRLDDAFRSYLAERGAKPVPLSDMTTLVTGVVGLRLAADAVLTLWTRAARAGLGAEAAEARRQLLAWTDRVVGWYLRLAEEIDRRGPLPAPVARDRDTAVRLVSSVRAELRDEAGNATANAVRMIWTGDHVDAARRLQPSLAAALATIGPVRDSP
jgi:uncharacterized membrane protein YccC